MIELSADLIPMSLEGNNLMRVAFDLHVVSDDTEGMWDVPEQRIEMLVRDSGHYRYYPPGNPQPLDWHSARRARITIELEAE